MSEQPKPDTDDTYVLDDETIEELDEASLTSVVEDLTNTMKRPKIEPPDPDGDDGGGDAERGEAID